MSSALNYLVAARRYEVQELDKLSRTCDLVLAAGELVHRLQQERGASNIFLASGGKRFAALRDERMAASDAAESDVRDWLDRTEFLDGLSGGARLCTRIAIALHALDELGAIRAAIGKLAYSPVAATERYNRIVDALLALVFEAADVAVDPAVSRLLIALFNLMQGKEFAGQERAAGGAAFAAGHIGPEGGRSIEYLIDMQEQSFSRFEAFCDDLRPQWLALQATLPLNDLERLRRKLVAGRDRPLDTALAEEWFDCCSQRIDGLHQVETHLATLLQQRCRDKVARRKAELEDHESLFATLAAADPLPPLAVFASKLEPAAEVRDSGGVGPRLTQAVVDMLQVQSQRLHNVTEELLAVRAALDERKIVERAKGLLMAHQGLSEEGAYRLLRQNAMNQNRRLVEVAQAVLSIADILPGAK